MKIKGAEIIRGMSLNTWAGDRVETMAMKKKQVELKMDRKIIQSEKLCNHMGLIKYYDFERGKAEKIWTCVGKEEWIYWTKGC